MQVRPEREQRDDQEDPPVGRSGVAREQPEERGEERHRVGLGARRRGDLDQDQEACERDDPGRRASEPARSERRDRQRGDQARRVRERNEREAADAEEPVRREVREPLLILPGMTGGERGQAIAVRKAVPENVAARGEAEPRVCREARRCDGEQTEREQERRNRKQRLGDRALEQARELRRRVAAPGCVRIRAHTAIIGRSNDRLEPGAPVAFVPGGERL